MVVSVLDAVPKIAEYKAKGAKSSILFDMHQFVGQPAGIGREFCRCAAVQMDGTTPNDGYGVRAHIVARQSSEPRFFFDIVSKKGLQSDLEPTSA